MLMWKRRSASEGRSRVADRGAGAGRHPGGRGARHRQERGKGCNVDARVLDGCMVSARACRPRTRAARDAMSQIGV
eukprot:2446906-Rhodomonas_salina.1